MPRVRYHESLAAPSYAGVRRMLAPPYRNLPAEDIEALLESVGIDPEYAESFWNDVGRTLGDVGKFVAPALPAVGAAVGTAFGGPVGTAVGGAAGSALGSVLSQPGPAQQAARPAARPAPRPAAPAPRPAVGAPAPRPMMSAPAPRPVVSGPAPVAAQPAAPPGSPAAAQLVQTLFRPELLQALLGMALGSAANPTVDVGGAEVPLAALTNLLGQLSDQASAEYHAITGGAGEGVPGYLEGVEAADLISPDVRAAQLLGLFQEADFRRAQVQRRRAARWEAMEAYYAEQMAPMESDDEVYDELAMVDFYANYIF